MQDHSPLLRKLLQMSHTQLEKMAEVEEEYEIDRVMDCVSAFLSLFVFKTTLLLLKDQFTTYFAE